MCDEPLCGCSRCGVTLGFLFDIGYDVVIFLYNIRWLSSVEVEIIGEKMEELELYGVDKMLVKKLRKSTIDR